MTIFKIRTRFMKDKISNLISNVLSEEMGCQVEVYLNDISIDMRRGRLNMHTDVYANIGRKDLMQVIKSSKD